jgi:transcription elongation factor GreA
LADGVPTAADLFREIGLRPDGPVLWGRPLTTRAPGIYVVELAQPVSTPPIELIRVGKWIETLPGLRLDGERPTSKSLAARLASLWLPGATVVYAGATSGSLGGRVLALAHHVLGDRRPHPDGHWLHLLRGIERTRIWFAETDAPEEYLDGLLEAFGATVGPPLPADRPAGALPLPWANLRRPTGERQVHGLTGALRPDEAGPPAPPTHVVEVAAGDADGARAETLGTGTVRRSPTARAPKSARPSPAAPAGAPRARRAALVPPSARPEPVPLTAEAFERLTVELDELTRVRRPEVVARIKAARELGDLRENAEYQAAREEQSFLEGRVRLLEERLRNAVLIEGAGGDRARIGSTVVVEHDGETLTYTLVGSTESDPASGRISVSSPVGGALVGSTAGAEVEVRTPRGPVRYRVVEIR